MASAEAELILKLNDQTQKGFESILAHLKQLQDESKKTAESTSGLGQAFGAFGEGLVSGFGIGLGFSVAQKAGEAFASAMLAIPNAILAVGASLLAATQKLLDFGAEMVALNARTGVSVEALQRLQLAGLQVGVGLDKIAAGINKMQQELVNAPEKFERLGLAASQLRSMKPEDQFLAIAESIGKIKDPAERAAAAVLVFGRQGLELLPLFTSNARAAAEEAEKLGLVLSENVVRSAEELGNQLDVLSAVWEGLKANIVAVVVESEPLHVLLEGITKILGEMSKQVGENRDGLRTFVDSAVVLAAQALIVLADSVKVLINWWHELTLIFRSGLNLFLQVAKGATDLAITLESIKGNDSKVAEFTLVMADLKVAMEENEKAAGDSLDSNITLNKVIDEQRAKLVLLEGAVIASVGAKHKATTASNDHAGGLKAESSAAKEAAAELKDFAIQFDMIEAAHKKATEAEVEFAMTVLDVLSSVMDARQRQAELEEQIANENAAIEQQAAEDFAEYQRQKEDALGQLSDALHNAGEEIGGFLGSIVSLGASGIDVFLNLKNQATGAAENIAAAANAVNAAGAAFKSGSILGGAGQGAAAGAAFGPWGAAIGAVGGALLGFFGKAKKAREELEKLRGSVLEQFGGMANLKAAAESVGVSIEQAFTTKSPAEAKRIFDELNEALEQKERRLEGLTTAMGGLDLMTQGFAASMARAGTATDQSQASFARLGNFAVATFAGLVRETGDLIGALDQMGPTLDTLQGMMAEFGLQASGAFARLLQLREVVVQNEDIANSISGLAQLMRGLGDAGLITRDILLDMGAQARANFDALIARGVDAEAAMSLMQPTLQELWEQHKKLGVVYDENTQALIDQAEQQGLVGESFLDVNEQMLEVLKILVETMGGELPAAMRRMGDAAEDNFNRARNAADQAADAASRVGHGAGAGGSHGGGGDGAEQGYATGIREVPRTMVARLHAGEEVVPASDRGARRSGAGGGAGVITIAPAPIILDGRQVGQQIQRRIDLGDMRSKSPLRRAG